ncbi:hypothetical protein ACIPY0_16080 [Paenarthrobacter nicotinovorans]|uniref:hypothetical protein n=1 Tax=Paenarthrobacter nicotinovorans TaxID=29320 RepID=UPI00381C2071
MDTGQLVLIIVVAVVVIAAVIIAVVVGRRKKAEVNGRRAGELREKAQEEAIGAHQAKAEAAQAEANALQAEAEANRLRKEAERHSEKAEEAHGRVEEHLRHADKLDPNATADRSADDGHGTHAGRGHMGRDDADRTSDADRVNVAEGERLTRDRSRRDGSTRDGDRNL